MEEVASVIPAEIEDFYGNEVEFGPVSYLETCPECGMNSVTRTGRCATCTFCGWSLCNI